MDTTTDHTVTQSTLTENPRYTWDDDEPVYRMPAGHHTEDYIDPRSIPAGAFYNRERDGILQCKVSQINVSGQRQEFIEAPRSKEYRPERTAVVPEWSTHVPPQHHTGVLAPDFWTCTPSHQEHSNGTRQTYLQEPVVMLDTMKGQTIYHHNHNDRADTQNWETVNNNNLPTPPDTDPRCTQIYGEIHARSCDQSRPNMSTERGTQWQQIHFEHKPVQLDTLQTEGPAEYTPRSEEHLTSQSDHIKQDFSYIGRLEDFSQEPGTAIIEPWQGGAFCTVPSTQESSLPQCYCVNPNDIDSVLVSDSASNLYPKPKRQVTRRYSAELRAVGINPDMELSKPNMTACEYHHDGECKDVADQGVEFSQGASQPFGFSGRTQSNLPTNQSTQVDSNGHYKPVKVDQYLHQIPEPPLFRYPYREIHALLLSWEEDFVYVDHKLTELHCTLWAQYQVTAERVTIPHIASHATVRAKIQDLIVDSSHYDTLFIVMYIGGATRTAEAGLGWFPLQNRDNPNRGSPDYPRVFWEAPQGDLEQADSDVIILMDTCGRYGDAPSSLTKPHQRQGTTEMLASFEFESFDLRAPTLTFTSMLITEMKKFADIFEVFSAVELHRAMVNHYNRSAQQGRNTSAVVPFFMRLSGKPQACSILFQPVEVKLPPHAAAVLEQNYDQFDAGNMVGGWS